MNRSPFISLVQATFRESLRNKAELFFNLFFPLLFLLIFGGLQRGADDYHKTWLGLYQSPGLSVEEVITQSGIWELKTYTSQQDMQKAIEAGDINLGLFYDGIAAKFLYKADDPAVAGKLQLARLSITAALEKHANRVIPILQAARKEESAGKALASGLDYTLAGIISISILSVGMMSIVSMFGRYRKTGVLNQLRVAPLRPFSFVFGATLSRVIISFISLLLILAASMLILKASFAINWLLLIITMICSTLGMMALGLLLNLIFRNPETANTTAGILMFVMYFLAGIFFPIALLPGYMKAFSSLLPLKYVSVLVRHSLGLEIIPIGQFAITALCLALGGILMLWLTGRKFLRSNRL